MRDYLLSKGKLEWLKIWFKNPRVPPPPPENENLGRSWHFEFELVWRVPPPHPPKMKIWADLGTLSLSWSGEYPHPLFHGARMWRLIAVSPVDTISFSLLNLL